MGLFGGKDRGFADTQAARFEIWGQRGWYNVEVVGESHHAREIRDLLSTRDLADGCRATLWMTTWTPKGVTVGDDGRLGLDLWQEESVASPA